MLAVIDQSQQQSPAHAADLDPGGNTITHHVTRLLQYERVNVSKLKQMLNYNSNILDFISKRSLASKY